MGPAPAQRLLGGGRGGVIVPGGGWCGWGAARLVMMAVPGRASRALPAVASLRDGLRPPLTPVPPPLLLVEGAAPGAGPGAAGRLARARPRLQAGGRLLGAVSPGWARLRLSGHRVVDGARSPRYGRGPGSAATGWWVARRRDRPGMGPAPAKRPQAGGQDAIFSRGPGHGQAAAGRWGVGECGRLGSARTGLWAAVRPLEPRCGDVSPHAGSAELQSCPICRGLWPACGPPRPLGVNPPRIGRCRRPTGGRRPLCRGLQPPNLVRVLPRLPG